MIKSIVTLMIYRTKSLFLPIILSTLLTLFTTFVLNESSATATLRKSIQCAISSVTINFESMFIDFPDYTFEERRQQIMNELLNDRIATSNSLCTYLTTTFDFELIYPLIITVLITLSLSTVI
ncbi:unnamed protein product [Didymodactylos carnosus]|uniref:Uncharacterized protein n=1 Tax=Didymodactylos carnosus TaxID=1234261 RepID=A0A814CS85_9BILA|nr:unnamed protein product [Didymodactylos carnosus]CAF3724346.1 unnamed protein product [Didymodactylos carnosus]